ncbi:MAG: nuclear transport factor 2 family protein [Alphaproteobacteria bacterium]|jgi:ketosteroid isomerase-like protein|nr:nuclear transport factor 2 family protein [Alphaproteobacteria bacterium]MDP6515220.1 nuclear transport factor 2 family protein [Alphaproteobacteria bacterium]|tara:strand:- start:20 stop:445 length:426 start_codon:yes stop_codon:yes gene_type:complete
MNSRPADRAALEAAVTDFTDAFNRDDLEAVMGYFADDAVYDEYNGARWEGKAAIREAFAAMFRGEFGRIRFHTEDFFCDPDSGKALIRWLCTSEKGDRAGAWRGLDILHFEGGKLVQKLTYAKAKATQFRKKDTMGDDWPG